MEYNDDGDLVPIDGVAVVVFMPNEETDGGKKRQNHADENTRRENDGIGRTWQKQQSVKKPCNLVKVKNKPESLRAGKCKRIQKTEGAPIIVPCGRVKALIEVSIANRFKIRQNA